MIKHTLAVAFVGLGIGCAGHIQASAAGLSLSTVPATAMQAADDTLLRVDGSRCFELPVVGSIAAFIELVTHEEFDRHCDRAEYEAEVVKPAYDDSKYVSQKDYVAPKDLKANPR